jgi:hydroxypyruvate reductase
VTISDRPPRALLEDIFAAAVGAADPLRVLPPLFPDPPKGRLVVLAAGKAAAAAALAAEKHYLDTLGLAPDRLVGLAATRPGHVRPTRVIPVVEAGRQIPDDTSFAAAERALALAMAATEDDLVLVLLSGGGSVNWSAPCAPFGLEVTQSLTEALLRSGAAVHEINAVRKHLSLIKGGRLAAAARPAPTVTLAISDVGRDDPSVIASGPTVPDRTTLGDARAILARYGIEPPPVIAAALNDVANETPKPGRPAFANARYRIAARPADAVAAAAACVENAGYEVISLGLVDGEARIVGADHAAQVRALAAAGRRAVLLSGGELTVTVTGDGRGGPNQEYALALALALEGVGGYVALAADTDGVDGGAGAAGDPAGAFADPDTLARGRALGLDPASFLARNDAGGFLGRTGDLFVTGPTLTNVNDIRAVVIDSHRNASLHP